MKKWKIHHISDTHTFHDLIKKEEDIDIVIHSGDCSNPRDIYQNEREVREFIEWYKNYPSKHKIYVAGNHDGSIERKFIIKEDFTKAGIIYLEHEEVEIEGIKIFGSPYTPTFGNWSFMKARNKLDNVWKQIPNDIDILIVHGPPKGLLDLSRNKEGVLEFCGCTALKKHVLYRIQPKLMCFGHIHNYEEIINAGVVKLSDYNTIFSNGSVVTDGKFGKLSSNGNVIELEK